MSRDKSVDIAKGIGIILVVWGHTRPCPVVNEICMFHMPLFFFLAGCFLKSESLKVVLYKRTRTLLVPLLFFYLVSLLVKLGRTALAQPSVGTLLAFDYSLANVNYPLWFIPTLFGAVVICNLLIFSNIHRGGYSLWC